MNKWSRAVFPVVLTVVSLTAAPQTRAQAGSLVQTAEGQSAAPRPGGPGLCGTLPFCFETLSFAARVTDFQANLQNGSTKTVTVRLSFRNKLSRPLILGYVGRSGAAMDDRGHKYEVGGDRAVQGIGVIQGTAGDQKFVLQPGEASDARFEFVWFASPQEIFGLSFQVDLAIREIDVIAGGQLRLGREHSLHFTGLGNRAATAPAPPRMGTPPPSPSGTSSSPAATAPAQVDPCAGSPACYNAGPFAAEVTALAASFTGNGKAVHVIKANVRFRNLTTRPVVLGYLVGTAVVTDENGNRYEAQGNQRGNGASGIGVVTRSESDPQFVLSPGASGNATFTMSRYKGDTVIGSTFAFDMTIAQLEVLPSDQVRTIREHSVGFTHLHSSLAGLATASPVPAEPGVSSQADGCAGKPRCYSADPFVAELTGLTASFAGNGNSVHVLKAAVRFRNTTNQPVVLAYIADSAVVTDNSGNRYQAQINRQGDGAAGIGTVTRAKGSAQFVLAPGASRDAAFTLSRYKGDSKIGSTFAFDMTIAQLEVLSGEQIRVLREYAVGFTALKAGGGSLLDRLMQGPPK